MWGAVLEGRATEAAIVDAMVAAIVPVGALISVRARRRHRWKWMIACRAGIAAGGAENAPMDWIRKSAAKGRYFRRGDSTRHCPGAPEATESDSTSAGTRERKLRAEENARTRSDRRANHRGRAPPIADLARLQAPNRRRASLGARAGPGSRRTIRRARDTRRGDHPEGDQGRVGGHHEGETPVGGPVTRASPTQEYPKTSVHSSSATINQTAHSLTRVASINHRP